MKKILTAVLVLAVSLGAYAQNTQGAAPEKKHQYNKESEKVAFISTKMNLTVEEAEVFWPIYNKINAEQKALNRAEREARKALREAMKAEVKDEKQIAKCLDNFTAAAKDNVPVRFNYEKQLVKAIGAEKTAKYYFAEDAFRNLQLKKLREMAGRKPQGMMPNGKRPEGFGGTHPQHKAN